jgi:hypothetical protein
LELAKQGNTLLGPSFSDVHQRVRRFFEQLLGDTVFFDDQYALPGFHIFLLTGIDASRDNVAARAHFDLQWIDVFPGCVPEATLSFTLPIETPSGGASMALWPIRYKDAVRLPLSAYDHASRHSEETVTYTPGHIVVHDGLTLHAIGRPVVSGPKGASYYVARTRYSAAPRMDALLVEYEVSETGGPVV